MNKENKQSIFNLVLGFILLFCCCLFFGISGYIVNHYTMECKVISKTTDGTVLKDITDKEWTIRESNNLYVGDFVDVLFSNEGTDDTRNDDKIVKYEYSDK